MQCLCGANLCTFITENAFCSILPAAGLFIDLYVHRADPQALSAVDAFIFIAVDTQKGKVAHRLEKYRDGT